MEDLKLAGLTDNEIKIYLTLLKHPESTGTEIRKQTGISNSRVYSCLDELIRKGIVNYQIIRSGKIFSAVDPKILSDILNEKKKRFDEMIGKLTSLERKSDKNVESSIFEGFNGFKNAFYKMIEDCPKEETIYIIGFSNQAYKNERLRLLLSNINHRSIKKKHKFKMILDDRENTFYQDRKFEGISQIRFMEGGFKSPAAIDVFADYVYIFLWDENPYAFMIKNENIAQGFRTYFEFLWNIAKK
ncbi:MAG: helix-turn-helix domain-containing protein [Nanoarchaeota archaeon]|nr:helix-turn-helix domain-containing protein [Nanoarchaeota archaeon]